MPIRWNRHTFFSPIGVECRCSSVRRSWSLYVLFLREEAFWGPPPGPKSYARLPGFQRRWRSSSIYYTAGRRRSHAADDSVESVRTMCRHHLLVVLQPLIAVQVSQCLASFWVTTQPLPASEGLGSLLIALDFTFEPLRLYSCNGLK